MPSLWNCPISSFIRIVWESEAGKHIPRQRRRSTESYAFCRSRKDINYNRGISLPPELLLLQQQVHDQQQKKQVGY